MIKLNKSYLSTTIFIVGALLLISTTVVGQRRPQPTATPTPQSDTPAVIRLAQEDDQTIYTDPLPSSPQTTSTTDLEDRIKLLEKTPNTKDPDALKRSLLLNLDILTRAEQRVELLRKQLFELLEKESSIKTRLDALEYEMMPGNLDRSLAFTGSLRPEEIRELKLKSLQSEKTNLTSLMTTIQNNRTRIEASVGKADQLVEKLSLKLEVDIDKALQDETQN